jgi:Dr1-associated corepressor
MPDSTYAPQSPDLSSFLSSASPQKKPPTSSYAPRSPNLPSFPTSTPIHSSHPQQHPGLGIGYQPSPQQQYQSYNDPQFNANVTPTQYGQYQSYLPPIPDLPPSHSFPPQQAQAPFQAQPFPPHQSQFKSELAADAQLDYHALPNISDQPEMSARSKRGAVKSENGAGSSEDLGPSQGIDIKTKFPVARIKRIMQADEEVGKVAQVTPVAVCESPFY